MHVACAEREETNAEPVKIALENEREINYLTPI
jgi:hypothetical protein